MQITKSHHGWMDNCIFDGNSGLDILQNRPSHDGMVSNLSGEENSKEAHNGHGGAILVAHSFDLNLTRPTFVSNWADGYGGALYSVQSARIALSESSFYDNVAFLSGGAVALDAGNLTSTKDQFESNGALNGAVLYVLQGNLSVMNMETTSNLAENQGGIVYCEQLSNVTFHTSKFVDDGSHGNHSMDGSSFMATCGCQLSVATSKIVCSNKDINGCGSAASDGMCNENVVFESAAVIHYTNWWGLLVLIIPALLVLPCLLILAKGCGFCTKEAAERTHLLNDSDGSLVEDLPWFWTYPPEAPEEMLDNKNEACPVFETQQSLADSAMTMSRSIPHILSAFDNQSPSLQSHCLTDLSPNGSNETRRSKWHKNSRQRGRNPPTRNSFRPIFPDIDRFYTLPTSYDQSSDTSTDDLYSQTSLLLAQEQHDVRSEYEEMTGFRCSLLD